MMRNWVSFLKGMLFAVFLYSFWQDVIGLQRFVKYVYDYWLEVHWAVWLLPIWLMLFHYGGENLVVIKGQSMIEKLLADAIGRALNIMRTSPDRTAIYASDVLKDALRQAGYDVWVEGKVKDG